MIQAHELRIGNWLLSADHNIPFQWTAEDFLQENSQAKPIPLTTEILEGCGFTLDASYPIPLWQDKFGFYFSDAWFAEYPHYSLRLMNRFDLKIDYLHQLQNLYFALTGQELEVNLPANQTA